MADNAQFNLAAFVEHAERTTREFEKRRVQFLHRLKFRTVLACILLFTFPFWYSLLTRWDQLGDGLSTVGLLVVHVLAAIMIIIFIIALAVRPLFSYRYDTLRIGSVLPGATGIVNQPVTLKEQLFTQLLNYFGNFRMHDDRKLTPRSFRHAPNIPDFDDYESSDYIRGHFDGVAVEMSEVTLYVRREASTVPVFNGLLIVLDINDANLVLRGKFSARTVLVQGGGAANDYVVEKYDGYKRAIFSDASFSQKLESYTTGQEEAGRLLSPEFLRSFLKLSDAVANTSKQSRSVDDKIAYALERIAGGLGDVIAAMASAVLNWFKTGRFRTESARHRITAEQTVISGTSKAFGSQPQCAFYDDKLLISIPTSHNLFEPDSVFQPPLTREDVMLIYGVMSELSAMVQSVVASLPKSAE